MPIIKAHYFPGIYWAIEVEVAYHFDLLVRAMTLSFGSRFPYGETVGYAANTLLQDYFIFMFYGNMNNHHGKTYGPAWERDKEY